MYGIVIGAGSEAIYAIGQAHKLGMKVLAFDGNKDAEGLKYADESFITDIRAPENIYRVIDEKGIRSDDIVVVPVPIGRYLITSGAVNDRYDLPGARRLTTEICTDKWLFPQMLSSVRLRKRGGGGGMRINRARH